MSAGLKDLLDDVAAAQVGDRRIDTVAVRAQAITRRKRLRANGSVLMLTAAAALAALIALPVFATLSVTPAAGGPGGLPDRWFFTPANAPTVQNWPMPAASMVLTGVDDTQVTVVSADTTRYARVETDAGTSLLGLSADGTRLAWLNTEGPDRYRVSVLRLADGSQRSTVLSDPGARGTGVPKQLLWVGDEVVVIGSDSGPGVTWRVSSSGRAAVGSCGLPAAVSATGLVRLHTSDPLALGDTAAFGCTDPEVAPIGVDTGTVVASDGHAAAGVRHSDGKGIDLVVGRGDREAAHALPDEVTGAVPLAWVDAGIVLRLDFVDREQFDNRGTSIALFDPRTEKLHAIGRRYGGTAQPLAIASGLVGDGTAVRADYPTFPRWTPEIARGVVGGFWARLWSNHWLLIVGGTALAGLGLFVVRWRRRRAGDEPEAPLVPRGLPSRAAVLRISVAAAFMFASAVLVTLAVPAVPLAHQLYERHRYRPYDDPGDLIAVSALLGLLVLIGVLLAVALTLLIRRRRRSAP